MISPILIPIVGILAGVAMVLGVPLVRALARRVELQGQQPQIPRELMAQLARMEQAIDAMAVEVERISEAQRFTTRLLGEQVESGRAEPRLAPAPDLTLTAPAREVTHAR